MTRTFTIRVGDDEDFEYEADYYDVRKALKAVSGWTDDKIEYAFDNDAWDGIADNPDDAFEELVDDYYDEICDYFQETKADDIKASIDMDEYVDWYYKYGRNL